MEVKTKLNIGQKAFFMKSSQVKSGSVERINVDVAKTHIHISYVIDNYFNLNESDVHASKEDLLKTL